jgi:hypothetical protein
MKSKSVYVSITIVFLCVSMHANIIDQKENSEKASVADMGKWHPKNINIVHPDMNIVFVLPHEKDRTGVSNLLFQCKETGRIHLLDTIKHNNRYFNSLLISGRYDAILLYNNGKYIRYNDVFFEKNNSMLVNMENSDIQPSNSISQYWLTLRTFSTAITERQSVKNYTTISEEINRGYIFDRNEEIMFPDISIGIKGTNKLVLSSIDGYFEIEADAYPVYLTFSFMGYRSQEIKLTANSGLVVVMEETFLTPEEQRKIKTGPLVETAK